MVCAVNLTKIVCFKSGPYDYTATQSIVYLLDAQTENEPAVGLRFPPRRTQKNESHTISRGCPRYQNGCGSIYPPAAQWQEQKALRHLSVACTHAPDISRRTVTFTYASFVNQSPTGCGSLLGTEFELGI